jgi:hypothetical protein
VVEAVQRALRRIASPFPPNILLRIAADACAGLHAAHELRDEDRAPARRGAPGHLAAERAHHERRA